MLFGALNIDFREKNPIDLFYSIYHKETLETIKSQIDQLSSQLCVGQT